MYIYRKGNWGLTGANLKRSCYVNSSRRAPDLTTPFLAAYAGVFRKKSNNVVRYNFCRGPGSPSSARSRLHGVCLRRRAWAPLAPPRGRFFALFSLSGCVAAVRRASFGQSRLRRRSFLDGATGLPSGGLLRRSGLLVPSWHPAALSGRHVLAAWGAASGGASWWLAFWALMGLLRWRGVCAAPQLSSRWRFGDCQRKLEAGGATAGASRRQALAPSASAGSVPADSGPVRCRNFLVLVVAPCWAFAWLAGLPPPSRGRRFWRRRRDVRAGISGGHWVPRAPFFRCWWRWMPRGGRGLGGADSWRVGLVGCGCHGVLRLGPLSGLWRMPPPWPPFDTARGGFHAAHVVWGALCAGRSLAFAPVLPAPSSLGVVCSPRCVRSRGICPGRQTSACPCLGSAVAFPPLAGGGFLPLRFHPLPGVLGGFGCWAPAGHPVGVLPWQGARRVVGASAGVTINHHPGCRVVTFCLLRAAGL